MNQYYEENLHIVVHKYIDNLVETQRNIYLNGLAEENT